MKNVVTLLSAVHCRNGDKLVAATLKKRISGNTFRHLFYISSIFFLNVYRHSMNIFRSNFCQPILLNNDFRYNFVLHISVYRSIE